MVHSLIAGLFFFFFVFLHGLFVFCFLFAGGAEQDKVRLVLLLNVRVGVIEIISYFLDFFFFFLSRRTYSQSLR